MSMRAPGGPSRGHKGPKMAKNGLWKRYPGALLTILGHSFGFLIFIPFQIILVYHFLLLPPLEISVKIMKICFLGELDGSKIKRIKDFGQL